MHRRCRRKSGQILWAGAASKGGPKKCASAEVWGATPELSGLFRTPPHPPTKKRKLLTPPGEMPGWVGVGRSPTNTLGGVDGEGEGGLKKRGFQRERGGEKKRGEKKREKGKEGKGQGKGRRRGGRREGGRGGEREGRRGRGRVKRRRQEGRRRKGGGREGGRRWEKGGGESREEEGQGGGGHQHGSKGNGGSIAAIGSLLLLLLLLLRLPPPVTLPFSKFTEKSIVWVAALPQKSACPAHALCVLAAWIAACCRPWPLEAAACWHAGRGCCWQQPCWQAGWGWGWWRQNPRRLWLRHG